MRPSSATANRPAARHRLPAGDGDPPGRRESPGTSFDDLLRARQPDRNEVALAAAVDLQFDDPINIQFTSAPPATQRAPRCRTTNILNNGFFVGGAIKPAEGDRLCIPVPLYHCFGMVMGNLGLPHPRRHHGLSGRRLRPLAVLETVAEEKNAPASTACPTMFIAELDHPDFADFDLSSLRTGIMAGSPCPIEVMKRVIGEDEHGRGDHRLRHDRRPRR